MMLLAISNGHSAIIYYWPWPSLSCGSLGPSAVPDCPLPPACSVDWPPPASVCPRGGWEEPGICCRGAGDRGVEFGELALPPGPDEKGGAWGVFDPKGSKPFENWKLPGVRFTNRRPPDVLFFAETLGASGELQCPEDFGVLFVP